LKIEIGEVIVNGFMPGSSTRALPTPVPTSAPAQRLRAWLGVAPSSSAAVQVGTPLKLIRPCLSNSKVSDFSAGRCFVVQRADPHGAREAGRQGAVGGEGARLEFGRRADLQRADLGGDRERRGGADEQNDDARDQRDGDASPHPFPWQFFKINPFSLVASVNSTSAFACSRPFGQEALT
jgi:hypothetical protein